MQPVMIQRVQTSTSIDDVMGVIDRDGAVIVSKVLSEPEIEHLHREVDKLFDVAGFCDGLFFGHTTKRVHSLIAKSAVCQKMAANPFIVEIMNKILGPYCEKIQINLTEGIQIWPGAAPQILHRDDTMFPAQVRTCEFMVNAMWACSTFTSQNGGTVLAPGSHKWPDKERRPTQNEMVQAEMEPGDALVYLGSLIHGGGENRSAHPRTGIIMGYCLGWLRQYENQYLAVPPEIAKNLPSPLQDLLGYAIHRPNLGMYEGNEPKSIFADAGNQHHVTRDWLTPEQNKRVQSHYELSRTHEGSA